MGFKDSLSHAWNAFKTERTAEEMYDPGDYSPSYNRSSRNFVSYSNERMILASINTRISVDVAAVDMHHVNLDKEGRYKEDRPSGLNDCLTVEANLDQAARAFRQDIILSLLEDGVTAIIPIDTTEDPNITGGYDINTMRVGTIVGWYPSKVKVHVYDEKRGKSSDVIVDKKYCAIVENPLYMVMNEPNSTLKRIIRKLNLLDAVDEQSASGKLDIIIQLPYTIRSEARRKQADQRRKDIEFQLKGGQYGIAYTDGAEKITQLNRPSENNLLAQVEYLMKMLYAQLGLTEDIMNGTADEAAMLNYYNRTVEPLLTAIVEAMHRTFLTKTARKQGQAIIYLRNPFRLVPIAQIADITDKFVRNQVASPNDIRTAIGWKPSSDPSADKLANPNMPTDKQTSGSPTKDPTPREDGGNGQNGT